MQDSSVYDQSKSRQDGSKSSESEKFYYSQDVLCLYNKVEKSMSDFYEVLMKIQQNQSDPEILKRIDFS